MAATAKPQGSQPTPSPTPTPSLMREHRLEEAMAEYLLAAEFGRAPDRGVFLARHPDLAGELASFLDDDEHLRRLAGSMGRTGAKAAGLLLGRGAGRVSSVTDRAAEEPLDPEFRPGGRIGDFELLESIAVGGMGIVFKARQISLNRIVALKTIRPGSLRPGDDAARRFRVEAEAVARLDHPGIVPIYEMGEHRGWPFLILKLIDGVDLERDAGRLRGEPEAIARLMANVARAVHYAHQRGILHRDLKPSNILLDSRGRAHVTDFGLARSLEADSRVTQTGLILGTPSFMAPEQVAGPRGEVTTAADVYGLGAVLYALLVGQPPFQGETLFETLRQVREQEPVRPSLAHPGVDRDLE
ncbi:MAG: serine/threonine-protein kinase, partial [Isosphaeraceae bacterium]